MTFRLLNPKLERFGNVFKPNPRPGTRTMFDETNFVFTANETKNEV